MDGCKRRRTGRRASCDPTAVLPCAFPPDRALANILQVAAESRRQMPARGRPQFLLGSDARFGRNVESAVADAICAAALTSTSSYETDAALTSTHIARIPRGIISGASQAHGLQVTRET